MKGMSISTKKFFKNQARISIQFLEFYHQETCFKVKLNYKLLYAKFYKIQNKNMTTSMQFIKCVIQCIILSTIIISSISKKNRQRYTGSNILSRYFFHTVKKNYILKSTRYYKKSTFSFLISLVNELVLPIIKNKVYTNLKKHRYTNCDLFTNLHFQIMNLNLGA